MRKISSVLSLILAVCLSIGGVSAAWVYATGDAVGAFKDFLVSMGTWEFGYTVSFVNETKEFYKMTEQTGTAISEEKLYAKSDSFTATSDMDTYAQANAIDALKVQIAQIKAGLITGVNFAVDYSKNIQFDYWINAGSTKITEIPADTEGEVVLYPSFVGMYTAMFVDQDGHIFEIDDQGNTAWTTFTSNDVSDVMTMADTLKARIQAGETQDTELKFSKWQIITVDDKGTFDDTTDDVITRTDLTEAALKAAEKDVTISPIYDFNGDVSLVPVDTDGDGVTNYYQVDNFNNGTGQYTVEIPDYVNGIPVTGLIDNSLSAYDDLHSVLLPHTITDLGSVAFADGRVPAWWGGTTTGTETVTIYYEGDYDDWMNKVNKTDGWDDNLGDGSRIFFVVNMDIDGDGEKEYVVDYTKGYIEYTVKKYNANGWLSKWSNVDHYWVYHDHPYPNADQVSNGQHTYNGTLCTNESTGDPNFHHATWTDYNGACDCGKCGTERPDAIYWPAINPADYTTD